MKKASGEYPKAFMIIEFYWINYLTRALFAGTKGTTMIATKRAISNTVIILF